MATIGDDRKFVVDLYQNLYDRKPTEQEVEEMAGQLQAGVPRDQMARQAERYGDPEADLTRIYRETLGRDPRPDELALNVAKLRSGEAIRDDVRKYLTNTSEALLRDPTVDDGPSQDEEDARDYLTSVLRDYGLESLGGWAWEQIQAGNNPSRVLQDLRSTQEYKQRFVGMEARKAAGLPAISEAEYIGYERDARQLMRAAGLPDSFYDSAEDFANFIGKDVSINELTNRINKGYLDATQAPAEVRQQLQSLYGVNQGQLAAYFLDPDKALPLIERQFAAAQISGAGVRTGYGDLAQSEAERLASLGISEAQAQDGFGQLASSSELFGTIAGEVGGVIDRATQQAAVFEGDASARAAIDRKAAARRSATSGAQAFQLGQTGASGLGTDNA